MIDGKISGILSVEAGAKCLIFTASFIELHDMDLVRSGDHINRTSRAAKVMFSSVDTAEYLALPTQQRFGLTHEPSSDIDIIPASPLHSYTYVFHWFMLFAYNLHTGFKKWSQTFSKVKDSLKFISGYLQEKTGMKIDQPSTDGRTTSTGNIARNASAINTNSYIGSRHYSIQIYTIH